MKLRAPAAALLILGAGALPLLVTRPAPLQDWPNHLARVEILVGLLRGDPFWRQFYQFTGFLVPNAALDVGILALTHAGLSVQIAAQMFLLGTYLVFVGGFCAAARASCAWDGTKPAFAVLLFYSYALFWGLVNYVFGTGLLLGLLAAWLTAQRRAKTRLGLAGAGGVLLLFTHVVPAVAWVAVLGCLDLHRFALSRAAPVRRCLDSASWLVALLVVAGLLRAMPGGTGHDLAYGYSGTGLAAILLRKLLLFAKALLGGSLLQDAASLLALLLCLAAILAARPRLAAAPALAVAGLAGLTLAAPEHIGTGSLLDQRLALLPLILAAAAVRVQPSRLGWLATLAVLARTLVLAAQFHAGGEVFAAYRRQSAALSPGGIMLMAYGTPLPTLSWQTIWSPPITSIAAQVVPREIFMPHIFANPAQQPIGLRAAFQDLTQPWDLTDDSHLTATREALAPLCAAHRYAGVYLTVLYPGDFAPLHTSHALLAGAENYLILDACRL